MSFVQFSCRGRNFPNKGLSFFIFCPPYSLKIFKYLKPSNKQNPFSLQKHLWFLLGGKNF